MNPPTSPPPCSLLGALLPDELIWSYYARILEQFKGLTLSGLASILGVETISWRKSFPTRLRNLASAVHFLGASNTTGLIDGHTFFPFARPEIFASEAERLSLSLMQDSFHSGAPRHLVLPGLFRLRICPNCALRDESKVGTSYWHRCHQIPKLRVCCVHGTPLYETDVTAGVRAPVTVTDCIVDPRPMEVSDHSAQRALAKAYENLAQEAYEASGEQVSHEVEQTLRRHGLFKARKVSPKLVKLLRDKVSDPELSAVGIPTHPQRLRGWCQIPKIVLILSALEEPFGDFMNRASDFELNDLTGKNISRSEHEQRLAEKVIQHAPKIAQHLREITPRRVTAWAIAKELNAILGAGFSGNWSSRGLVKEALHQVEETEDEFVDRALVKMRQNPEIIRSFPSFSACAKGFGVYRYTLNNEVLKERVHLLFRGARDAGFERGKLATR